MSKNSIFNPFDILKKIRKILIIIPQKKLKKIKLTIK